MADGGPRYGAERPLGPAGRLAGHHFRVRWVPYRLPHSNPRVTEDGPRSGQIKVGGEGGPTNAFST